MIIMHARPRQTDRRTNIIAIARRLVVTNASRISRVNNEVSRSLLSKVRAWTGQTHRWTHTDGRNLTHYQLHYVPLHSVLYSITIIIKIGSSLTMQRYRDTEVEFCWRLDSSRNAALPSSPCMPARVHPTTDDRRCWNINGQLLHPCLGNERMPPRLCLLPLPPLLMLMAQDVSP